ncbi:SBBP repeat-containing protein [Niastella sp. OAS944]|uniref:SBBP repeat-containing protein n=1 Tax=Niastella sp. OAS944 TaxID=2664089 RepID=UPI0034711C95|nr:hypothetical protein [Chitinophagaceae bacterium OAS944]
MIRLYFSVHRLLLGISVFIIPLLSQSQDVAYRWGRALTSTATASGYSVALDARGNIYTTGFFSGTLDADPTGATVNLTSTGSDDIFITKLDTAGLYVWSIQLGAAYSDRAFDITTDAAGNTYVTGYFNGTLDFDPGPGVASLTAAGGSTVFVAKYNAAGDYEWATPLLTGMPAALTLDATGNIYATGSFTGASTVNTSAGSTTLASAGANDAFVLKLDATGACQWAKQMGGAMEDLPGAITVDHNGNVYSTGRFNGIADYDPGAGTATIKVVDTGYNIYVSKLNANGDFVYVKSIAALYSNDITVDNADNLYFTGTFNRGVNFDPNHGWPNWVVLYASGASDAFVAKFDAAGNYVWVKQIGGNSTEYSRSIALDDKGNVYTTGIFYGYMEADPEQGISPLTSAGGYDVYISLLDPNGNYIWGKSFGGVGLDESYGLAVDPNNSIYTVGSFNGMMDIDPGPAAQPVNAGSGQGVFINKLLSRNNQRDAVFVWGDWIPAFGGTATGTSVATDSANNVYMAGFFQGEIDIDPSYNRFDQDTATGGEDMFIVKVDASGNKVWKARFGAASNDRATKIAVDAAGNTYVTGYFTGTVDFDPGPGTANLSSVDGANAFVLKLSPAGQYLWATNLLTGEGQSIAIDAAGNSYITGVFAGTVDVSTPSGPVPLTSSGANDVFVIKLDANGNIVWVKQMGGTGDDRAQAIALDGSGNIYTCGQSANGGDFDPGTGITMLTAGVYISKLNSNGGHVWAKQINATYGNDLATDSGSNIYLTGIFDNTVDFDPGAGTANLTGTSSAYILKLDALGNYIWVKQLSSALPQTANGITVDAAGNVFTTGSYTAAMDADPGPGTALLTDSITYTVYISKLDRDGNYVWAETMHTNYKSNVVRGYDVAVDKLGGVLTIGYFTGLLDMDPGPNTFSVLAGYYPYQRFGQSVFVSKLRQVNVADGSGGEAGPLPLTWLTVDGHLNSQQQPVINFTVAETSVKDYSIEKTEDGVRFTSIGTLISKGDGENHYSFTEAAVLQKAAWYRILQTDIDGHSSYSSVIRLIPGSNSPSIVAYPVPVTQSVTIQITGDALLHTKALLVDAAGRPLQTIIFNNYNTSINMSHLPGGVYILRLANGTSVKLVKK